jgi:hypothetical protein
MKQIAKQAPITAARLKEPYIAILGDIVGSRKLANAKRRSIQTVFSQLMDRLNASYSTNLKAKFTITLGDEFEGLLSIDGAQTAVPDIIWTVEDTFATVAMRIGIGLGTVDTGIPEYAAGADGPAFHRAREAIELAAKKQRLGGVFRGFGDRRDAILNGLARVLHRQRDGWSKQQRMVARHLRNGSKQTDAASAMGLSKQAVSAYARAAGWEAYSEGEIAWRKAIEEALERAR